MGRKSRKRGEGIEEKRGEGKSGERSGARGDGIKDGDREKER